MKAKFIRHNDARKSLGVDILSKREFDSYEEFINWLYRYAVPDFYKMDNGPKLWNLIKRTVKRQGTLIPIELYEYIVNEIKPSIQIKNYDITYMGWDPEHLRGKYPFPVSNKDLQE